MSPNIYVIISSPPITYKPATIYLAVVYRMIVWEPSKSRRKEFHFATALPRQSVRQDPGRLSNFPKAEQILETFNLRDV